ncbi:hypothetical protein AC578_2784 [Pseudocercospora eumusae]|uniref:F-box domain-containing protein n=1 Tax=Pseudocercospora eumusae TaxID=321146 RepID=A0A139HH29_9PEZI|nr:hypothetical protein AC578_2784 [Pseudocercospora eumusae]KXT01758.1 hypothetical protein AC578_2784 [Pseudocercospora eumusae]
MTDMMSPPFRAEHHEQAQIPEPSFMACHETLETVELLEEILSHLPMKDLLFAQRISRTWQNCIKNSKRLQQGLFFRAPGAQPTVDLVGELFNRTDPEGSDPCKDSFLQSAVINPLLRKALSPKQMAHHLLRSDRSLSSETAFARPEASWRNMLWTYPELKSTDAKSFALRSREAFIASGGHRRPHVEPRALEMWNARIRAWFEKEFTSIFLVMEEPKTTAELEARLAATKQA